MLSKSAVKTDSDKYNRLNVTVKKHCRNKEMSVVA